MIEYKFNSIVRDGVQTTVKFTVWRGAVTTEDELVVSDTFQQTLQPVTRYRRTQKLGTYQRTFNRDISEDEIRTRINEFLDTLAAQLGETVIPEQAI